MTYNPSVPGATDIIAASQSDIQTNFSQTNTQFGINHEPLTTVSAQAGYHTKIFFPTGLGGDPGLVAPENSVYSKLVSGVAQLFFQNGALSANVKQLTGLVVTLGTNLGTAGGSLNIIDTPWGFRLYFGLSGSVSSTAKFVNFPTAFTTVYSSWGTVSDNNANPVSIIGSKTQLRLVTDDGIAGVNWFCFGVL